MCGLQSVIALQMQHQGVLGKLWLLGAAGSNAQLKTAESLFNLDLLQRTPEFHHFTKATAAARAQSGPNPRALPKFPKSLWALRRTIKTEIA